MSCYTQFDGFFFQAEDGIRDLVRSRGLGDVYKRQGLRQLYFLIGGLLKRLVYLSIGLAVLLAFIGVKLILHALHENNLPFINGGQPLHGIPDIPISVSLGAIGLILGCLLYTSAADAERSSVDLGGSRIIKKKKIETNVPRQEKQNDQKRIHT